MFYTDNKLQKYLLILVQFENKKIYDMQKNKSV